MIFDKKLLDDIAANLVKNHQSIATAESVTAGLLQAALSNAKNASLFFQGGITAYNVGQKCRHLLVEPLHAIACDSVSEKIAVDLSKNVCDLFTSDYGIGSSGYAARVPEKNVNDLFMYYSICCRGKILDSGKLIANTEEGLPAQLYYVSQILERLSEHVNK